MPTCDNKDEPSWVTTNEGQVIRVSWIVYMVIDQHHDCCQVAIQGEVMQQHMRLHLVQYQSWLSPQDLSS